MENIDLGYKDSVRQFVDVNGDGLIDFCREVGNRPHSYIACMISTDNGNGFQEDARYRITDKGYHDSIRQFADVDGDGKADYCREVGNQPNTFIACALATDSGFDEYGYRVSDKGYANSIRQFADVNGDGKADYCREVGNQPNTFIACTLGVEAYGYVVRDKGYANSIRHFADVNGDGKAEYCREVGNQPNTFIACALATDSGVVEYGYIIRDKGYENSLRHFADVNGDGKADYCREVGNQPNTFIACALGTDNVVKEYEYIIRDKGYHDSVRQFADVNGDGKVDYCREVGNRPASYMSCAIATDSGFDEYGLKLSDSCQTQDWPS